METFMPKTIAILGVTGSVGVQAADVAERRGCNVDLVTANRDISGAEIAARRLKPRTLVMADEAAARELSVRLSDTSVKVYGGESALFDSIGTSSAETVVNSILGKAGLLPSLAVIKSKKRLALANKESLVIAGELVMNAAKESGVEIIPVDSEHSAIFQSLSAGKRSEIKRILLTASGGPFFGRTREQLSRVTLSDTLAHPTWKMGRKITVDSATLMNKGFEIIEAVHLFGVAAEKVEVLIHRESILHSAVEYIDNTVIGELSVPDMRMCVQYAVDYPDRAPASADALDLFKVGKLSFMPPDTEAFPCLSLAREAISRGGAMGAVLNAADEEAVSAFLDGRIGFNDIPDTVGEVCTLMSDRQEVSTLDGILAADSDARRIANEIINKIN